MFEKEFLIYIAAILALGFLTVAAFRAMYPRKCDDPQEPGDHAHHPDSLRNVFRINGRRDDA
jgi:hypothetical protein